MRQILLLGVVLSLLVCGRPLSAANPDDSLLIYAVNIHRTPTQSWSGSGIYLGNGLFITAAHVVGHGWLTRPKVVIGEQEYATRVVKEGSLEGTDLTLLSVEEAQLPLRLRLRRNPICVEAPSPGEEVITVVPGSTARSRVIAPERLPLNVRNFSTVIGDVAGTGNSGSGVFDAQRRCLLGIMSRKISLIGTAAGSGKRETRDIAKYFVPAAVIAAFIPAELRF
jgi:hypothetical protein